jgi:membrane-associated phospholipid phosphatase
VSDVGGVLQFVAILVAYVWMSRPRAYYYVLLYGITVAIMSLTKIAYHEPRPYMTESEVYVNGCTAEYGNPSGHAMLISSIMLTAFFDLYFSDPDTYARSNKVVFGIVLGCDIGFILLVGFSRLFNGVHTIDQIILGYLFGSLVAFTMHFCIREPLFNNIENLLHKSS